MGGIFGGGGGGGSSAPAPAPSSQTVTNTSIPAYAQPYVETMLGQASALTDINQNPYQTYGGQRIAEFSPMQQRAFNDVANQTTADQLNTGTAFSTASGLGSLGTTNQAGQYGNIGNMYGGMGNRTGQQYGRQSSMLGYGALGQGQQGAGIGASLGQMSTDPRAVGAYMSPYIENALAPSQRLLNQQYGMQSAAEQGAATQRGAFGGSRNALMQGLNEQNRMLAQNQLVSNAYQQAYTQGIGQMNQANQAALAGNQQALSGYGMGLQGANQAGQLGLAGTGQGITGAQVGLQGVGAQQAGYAGANQAAGTLGQLGQSQFGQEQAINQSQQTVGAVQQAQAQQALDQAYADFNKQKNYPYQQLAFMSDMVRGLPLSQSAQSQYTAPPSAASQLGGLGMAGLGIYGMSGGFKQAKGGMVGEGHANGGLMAAKAYKEGGYADGGDISMLNVKQLQDMLDNPTLTPMEVEMIEKRIMLLNRMQNNPQSDEIMAPAEGQQMAQRSGIGAISTGNMVPEEGMAGGGIVAFAAGGQNKENYQSFLENQVRKSIEDQLGEDSFSKSGAEKAKLESAIAARQERSPYEALAMAGLGTMAGTSQYGLTNVAQGGMEGLKSYSKNMGQETSDRQKLLEQQVYADKAEQARKAALTGQMQTTLGGLYAKQAAQAAAGANSEDKALLRVMALINQDDDIPKLIKERDLLGPRDPNYKAYNDAINAIKKGYFDQAGIKRPFVSVPGVQLAPEPEKTTIMDDIKGFFSSKPEASKNKVVPYSSLPK